MTFCLAHLLGARRYNPPDRDELLTYSNKKKRNTGKTPQTILSETPESGVNYPHRVSSKDVEKDGNNLLSL